MKKFITIAPIAVLIITLFASCGSGGLDGTYIPKNSAAKNNNFAKFVFNDGTVSFLDKVFQKNTVKVYMGVMGIAMPMAYEYSYSLKGDKLIIEAGIPGVSAGSIEFTYNKANDEISMNMDAAFDILGGLASSIGSSTGNKVDGKEVSNALKSDFEKEVTPVWGKEGTFDPNNLNSKKEEENISNKPNDNKENIEDICKEFQLPEKNIEMNTVEAGSKFVYRWEPFSCATDYILHWSFWDENKNKKGEGNTGWIDKNEWTHTVPDECGYLYMNVYARDSYKRESKSLYFISVKVTKTNSIPTLTAPEKVVDVISKVDGCKPVSFSWKPVTNAQFYVINWSLDGKEGSFITDVTSAEITLPNVNGHLYIDVFACGCFCGTWVQSSNTLFSTKVEAHPQPSQAMDGSIFCNPSKYIDKLTKPEVDLIEEYLNNSGQFEFFDGLDEINTKIKKSVKSVKIVSAAFQQSEKIGLIIEIEKEIEKGSTIIVENFDNLYALLDKYQSFNKLLDNINDICRSIELGIIAFHLGKYWLETKDTSHTILWGSCEAVKFGLKRSVGFGFYLSIGCKIGTIGGGVAGAVVGCIAGGVVGLAIEHYINNKFDCEELTN